MTLSVSNVFRVNLDDSRFLDRQLIRAMSEGCHALFDALSPLFSETFLDYLRCQQENLVFQRSARFVGGRAAKGVCVHWPPRAVVLGAVGFATAFPPQGL